MARALIRDNTVDKVIPYIINEGKLLRFVAERERRMVLKRNFGRTQSQNFMIG